MADVTQKIMSASCQENSRQEAGWPFLADRSVFDVATCVIFPWVKWILGKKT